MRKCLPAALCVSAMGSLLRKRHFTRLRAIFEARSGQGACINRDAHLGAVTFAVRSPGSPATFEQTTLVSKICLLTLTVPLCADRRPAGLVHGVDGRQLMRQDAGTQLLHLVLLALRLQSGSRSARKQQRNVAGLELIGIVSWPRKSSISQLLICVFEDDRRLILTPNSLYDPRSRADRYTGRPV